MFKNLATFKIVYETKNFSKAAELLFIAQPTVSAQIKQLENELETSLFIRNGRKEISATPQADLLYQKAVTILDEWKNLETELKQEHQGLVDCRVAASHTFALYLLPELLMALYQNFPQVRFQIQMLNSLEVVTALEHHEVDFGFIEKPLSAKNIQRQTLMTDQLVLAGDVTKGPWLIREDSSGVYYYTQRYLAEKDIREPTLEIQNNEIIVSLLRQGFGCSIISKRAANGIPHQDLPEKYIRQFYLVKREQKNLPELEKILTYLPRFFAEKA